MGAPAIPIAVTGDGAVFTGQCIYKGFTFRETGAANPVNVQIFDGTSAAGTLLETLKLGAGESVGDYYESGVRAAAGIYVEVSGTGTIEGSVRLG